MNFLDDFAIKHAELLVRDSIVQHELRRQFGRKKADKIIASLLNMQPLAFDEGELLGALMDIVLNDGELYSQFTAEGAEHTYHIDVKGLGGLYWTYASEFGHKGFFMSLDDAEGYVVDNWSDNLESAAPNHIRIPFEYPTENPKAATADVGKPTFPKEPTLRIESVGAFSRLSDGTYYRHQTSLFMSPGTLSANELALRVLDAHLVTVPDIVLSQLHKQQWDDVISLLHAHVAARREKRARDEAQRVQTSVGQFQQFLERWKPEHAAKWPDPNERLYWAARDYVWETGDYATRNPEEISIRRMHQVALIVMSDWKKVYQPE